MIIDQLPEISTVQETDEIPVERGTKTYKAKIQKLKDLLPNDERTKITVAVNAATITIPFNSAFSDSNFACALIINANQNVASMINLATTISVTKISGNDINATMDGNNVLITKADGQRFWGITLIFVGSNNSLY